MKIEFDTHLYSDERQMVWHCKQMVYSTCKMEQDILWRLVISFAFVFGESFIRLEIVSIFWKPLIIILFKTSLKRWIKVFQADGDSCL